MATPSAAQQVRPFQVALLPIISSIQALPFWASTSTLFVVFISLLIFQSLYLVVADFIVELSWLLIVAIQQLPYGCPTLTDLVRPLEVHRCLALMATKLLLPIIVHPWQAMVFSASSFPVWSIFSLILCFPWQLYLAFVPSSALLSSIPF